ncbi:hypothetical protein DVA67_003170 [Solirubrobacter sp. CPCC 204708]|uniref:Uncharacterized protein n=1 Tax=Solirubrobacter deserti TaxID=2282478 RepID=A0ABT4RNV7_9ACTN|nr:hypothetical protein [Solirubrobacter deserti]MBE2314959.1 hypothetical protein [Solirubrobacter deserti]MDA0140191.1 hypothetical protein [Solirubrobacter deserti]
MFYSLLGRVVWFVLKLVLRRKYGPTYVPKSLLAGVTVAVGIAIVVAIQRAARDSD